VTKCLREIKVDSDLSELSKEAATLFTDTALRAVEEHGRFCVCLSGGSTPRETYAKLARHPFRSEIPWHDVHAFWGDERCVPPDHPDNLYGMAWELMLSKVPIPAENVYRMRGEAKNPRDAAAEYEELLKDFFGLQAHEYPRLDLILLGMGTDGHTASLFPGTVALGEKWSLAIANFVPTLKANRLTLTLPVLNNAALVMFLISGESKARALHSILRETEDGQGLPAGMIDPQNGRVLWLIDRAAADLLESSDSGSSDAHELL
jgi:6-phosphogluconolactonase